ncbi:hypothetical protein BT69DRAFT_855316 [Atractiella rhizophila]|nr:hypothetical protein BT69DRAFT_855316 [Atractiella rhizophila]
MSKDKESGRFGGLLHGLRDKVTQGLGPGVEAVHQSLRQSYAAYNPAQSQYTLKLAVLLSQMRSLSLSHTSTADAGKKFSKSFFIFSQQPALSNNLDNLANDNLQDYKDICDRLSFFVFQSAMLEGEYAKKLESSRTVLKEIRNFEENLIPRRDKREALKKEITKIEGYKPESGSSSAKRYAQQLAQLRGELQALNEADAPYEDSMASVKRQKVHDSFLQQFEAMKEYGEKLAIMSEYGKLLLQGMDVKEGGRDKSYGEDGLDRTKLIRGLVQEELEGWTAANSEIQSRTLGAKGLRRRETDTR